MDTYSHPLDMPIMFCHGTTPSFSQNRPPLVQNSNLALPPIVIPSDFELYFDFGRTLDEGIPYSHQLQSQLSQSPMYFQPMLQNIQMPAAPRYPPLSSQVSNHFYSDQKIPTTPLKEPPNSNELVPSTSTKASVGYKYVNVTPYLHLPQHEAARELSVPSSTLSKRWREATMNRNWPHRVLRKLDKQILLLVKNSGTYNSHNSDTNESDLSQNLSYLLAKRKEEAKVVFIRL